jgi:serine O-acetyltransferase
LPPIRYQAGMTQQQSLPEPDSLAGTYGDISPVLDRLKAARQHARAANWRNVERGAGGFPSRHDLRKIFEALVGALFPLRLGPSFVRLHNEDAFVDQTLRTALSRIYGQIRLELGYVRAGLRPDALGDYGRRVEIDQEAARIIDAFAESLPEIRGALDLDIAAAFRADPAARGVDEVLIAYPSVEAIIHHRLAHRLHTLGAPLVARIVAASAQSHTGVDIHPAAQIGEGLVIDHGTGLVIGETAILGRNVRLHQAVTLGARNFDHPTREEIERGAPRHPILDDDVVVYPGATLLGRIRIGRGAIIGGNVWLTQDVPAGARVEQGALIRTTG